MTNDKLIEVLEALVDAHSLATVVSCLAEVATLKEDHLKANWGDDGQARDWWRAYQLLTRVTPTLHKLGV